MKSLEWVFVPCTEKVRMSGHRHKKTIEVCGDLQKVTCLQVPSP